MKIEYDGNDDVILDLDELAREFQLAPDTLRRYLRMGLVASTVERGEGDDLGKDTHHSQGRKPRLAGNRRPRKRHPTR